MHDESNETK